MILDNFRAKLRQEVEIWRDEGLIDNSQYQQLVERYQFNNLEHVARDRFVFILIGLGSILLGLGVITFVAANWQVWSREVKLTLLLGLFVITSTSGFYFWRKPVQPKKRQRQQILGQGLLLFGALLIGANMALLAQIFHMSGSGYELFLAWGIGVLVMAYSLNLTSLGVLALILVQIGYWVGIGEFWFSPRGDLNWAWHVVQHMPLLSWVLFLPLAYLCESAWLFTLAAIAFASSLQFNLSPLQYITYQNTAPWVASFAFALPPALLWSYDDLIFPLVNFRWFQYIARNLTLIFFSILFYSLSFRGWWQHNTNYSAITGNNQLQMLPLIDLGIMSGLAILQWCYLLLKKNKLKQKLDINHVFIGSLIIIVALVPLWHQMTSGTDVVSIFIFNALLTIFACGLIRVGLELTLRQAFWGGMILLTLQIISRMLEYDTALLLKSLVFILCGVVVIIAGLWFEKRLHKVNN
ncbi:DUF2157 domain-containing protein [Iningainema tapete]|uniref:DUF2157 domain-containing protein n=1 Tax=Iningainema tapete BLCC-T55 TaxID=2748662 RepID=A0A8J6XEZ0_9CYAN|nr:DUF2157 domain-containing protein [Iningainema tapete]MBD2775340.1 DUF2157 domain-containing protein [Iningainema tapete BLCC-T55]